MNTTTNYTIDAIQAINENDAAQLAEESTTIKEHTIYFVDFPGYFGYSCLVFKDGAHIYYANDYELHHHNKTQDELKKLYTKSLNAKLYTDEEIKQPLKTYDEYKQKRYYLRNYYGMRRPYLSIFGNFNTQEKIDAYNEKKKNMVFDPFALAYYEPQHKEFIKQHIKLCENLEKCFDETINNYEFQKSAFYYEMLNHEYAINWQADFDTLSAFGNIKYAGYEENELQSYFKQLNFNDTQKRAYIDAARAASRVEY